MKNEPGVIWIKLAVVYFAVGVSLGIYMGASGDHTLFSVHAHINLLGWVSLALIGLIYNRFPQIGANGLARTQFWLHNLGAPVMLALLVGVVKGNKALEPVLGIASIVVGVSVVLFLLNVWLNLKPRPQV